MRQPRICDCGDHGFVGLTSGQVALFSPASLTKVSQANWGAFACKPSAYARGVINGRTVLMHRHLTNAGKGLVVDHINFQTLDNRLENLRVCTQSENLHNREKPHGQSSFLGVHWSNGCWRSQICVTGRRINLGAFETEELAANAYAEAKARLVGSISSEAST